MVEASTTTSPGSVYCECMLIEVPVTLVHVSPPCIDGTPVIVPTNYTYLHTCLIVKVSGYMHDYIVQIVFCVFLLSLKFAGH